MCTTRHGTEVYTGYLDCKDRTILDYALLVYCILPSLFQNSGVNVGPVAAVRVISEGDRILVNHPRGRSEQSHIKADLLYAVSDSGTVLMEQFSPQVQHQSGIATSNRETLDTLLDVAHVAALEVLAAQHEIIAAFRQQAASNTGCISNAEVDTESLLRTYAPLVDAILGDSSLPSWNLQAALHSLEVHQYCIYIVRAVMCVCARVRVSANNLHEFCMMLWYLCWT